METNNLKELRELRNQEKVIKARIDAISDAATQEALTIAPDGGEFTIEGHRFQLQRTQVIDMANFHRYKDEQAQRWRARKDAQDQAKKYSAALTKEMKAIVDGFLATHPYWEPDEVKLTVKVID
ncbi:MAG: hypothetical protein IJ814_06265 [Paludibacteraceae bacterium]|nr:hypothetical protein [Paludibacteraceae bacterium]